MAGSDGVLASNLIREANGNNFRRENMHSEFKNSICPNRKAVTNILLGSKFKLMVQCLFMCLDRFSPG